MPTLFPTGDSVAVQNWFSTKISGIFDHHFSNSAFRSDPSSTTREHRLNPSASHVLAMWNTPQTELVMDTSRAVQVE
jgi:hypothetical protein